MKTIISSTGDTLSSNFDLRFGRAAWFCIYDEQNKTTEFILNEFVDSQGGAGTKAAEKMASLEANKVISGHFGPKAKDLLNKLNIQMVALSEENASIEDIITKIK